MRKFLKLNYTNILKAIQVTAFIVGIGMFLQQMKSNTEIVKNLESRMRTQEELMVQQVVTSKQTGEAMVILANNMRNHEIEDAAVTADVKRNTEIIDRLVLNKGGK